MEITIIPGPLLRGACDASGGIVLGGRTLVVANDEDNVVRYYDLEMPDAPPIEEDWSNALRVEGADDELECDIESATALGDLVFWIGSHSQSRKGKNRPNRHRLFATRPDEDGRLDIVPGSICTTLLDALLATDKFFGAAATIAPKEPGGLNIESLCDTPDGKLLVGFRNPIPEGLALLVPVNNPGKVAAGKAPKLGAAIRLDLGGLGLRDMLRSGGSYLILAGGITDPANGAPPSQLFTWAGPGSNPVVVGEPFVDWNPEGLVLCGSRVFILSDDGARAVTAGGPACKEAPASQRCFRTRIAEGWPAK